MQKPSDETLVAYLDGELDGDARGEVESWLDREPALRDRLAGLAASAQLLRAALEPVVHEPVPERLLATARRTPEAAVIDLAAARQKAKRGWLARPWLRWAAAAGVAGLVIGGATGYFAGGRSSSEDAAANLASANWLDNIAGYHKLFVAAGADDQALADVPANAADAARKAVEKLPPNFKLPNLKPWGLEFQGARYLVIDGQRATQLFYTTSNKALGPLTIVIGGTSRPDLAPTFVRRDDLNMLYWRHHGRAYALVGTADIGYLWNISNDIEYQLDAI